VRIRVSNELGSTPLRIGAARIGVRASGSDVAPGTDRVLTFSGRSSVVIPPGAPVLSDPVELNVPALGDARYPRFSWSSELVDGLDAVLLSTEPYRFTQAHADALEKQLGIPVFLVDGEMMSWYGSRALPGLRYLREVRAMVEGTEPG